MRARMSNDSQSLFVDQTWNNIPINATIEINSGISLNATRTISTIRQAHFKSEL